MSKLVECEGVAVVVVSIEIVFAGGQVRRLRGQAADEWLTAASKLSVEQGNALLRSDWEKQP